MVIALIWALPIKIISNLSEQVKIPLKFKLIQHTFNGGFNKYYDTRPNLTSISDIYNIHSSFFYNMSVNSPGAAIKIINSKFPLKLFQTGFINCLSTSLGGAIYYESHKFSARNVCFEYCTSMEGGQAIYAALAREKSSFTLENSMISYSSQKDLIGLCRTIAIDYGNQTIEYLNSTSNSVEYESSSLHTTRNACFAFKFSTIFNNSGSSLFWLHSVSMDATFDTFNIIENDVSLSSLLFFEDCDSKISNFVFLRNKGFLISGSNTLTIYNIYLDNSSQYNFPISMKIYGDFNFTDKEAYAIMHINGCSWHHLHVTITPNPTKSEILRTPTPSLNVYNLNEPVGVNLVGAATILLSIAIVFIAIKNMSNISGADRNYKRQPLAFI